MTAVLVTRPRIEAPPLVSALRGAAFRVHAVPTIELAQIPSSSPAGRRLRQTFLDLRPADWIVVTSRFGASVAARQMLLADGLSYAPVRWAAIGPAAARALAVAGIRPDIIAPAKGPCSVVAAMATDRRLSGQHVIVARSDVADPWLPQVLAAAGAEVEAVTTYRTIEGPRSARSAMQEALSDPDLRAIVVASGSAARGLVRMVEGESRPHPIGVASQVERVRTLSTITIGPATTAAACSVGLRVAAEADEPTIAGIVRAVTAALASADPSPIALSGGFDR
jgi:uroporphyrinogen-III synthase